MPRVSKKDKAKTFHTQVETVQTGVEITKEVIELVVEEGLWITMMVDMFLVGGELVTIRDDFLIAQRKAISKTLQILTNETNKAEFLFLEGNIPNPAAFIFGWLKPLVDLLNTQETRNFPAEIVKGRRIPILDDRPATAGEILATQYFPLPPFERSLLTFALPGVFRTSLQLLAGKIV